MKMALVTGALLAMGAAQAAALAPPGPVAAGGTVIPGTAAAAAERPCDFSGGVSLRVPTSADETVEQGIAKQKADAVKPKPRFGCLLKLSPQKFSSMLLHTHMGMQNGRAGIFANK